MWLVATKIEFILASERDNIKVAKVVKVIPSVVELHPKAVLIFLPYIVFHTYAVVDIGAISCCNWTSSAAAAVRLKPYVALYETLSVS